LSAATFSTAVASSLNAANCCTRARALSIVAWPGPCCGSPFSGW
jgi:hypothetical protein